ncbi:MAG: hypothetical protein USCGTAYLOR_02923 [Chromatiales bacterium USCg_Taylor]|nr:MAG: hypothetical protein USCGTAYLOR_02923 [Chromatiales bacterium USCg_Taylor]
MPQVGKTDEDSLPAQAREASRGERVATPLYDALIGEGGNGARRTVIVDVARIQRAQRADKRQEHGAGLLIEVSPASYLVIQFVG